MGLTRAREREDRATAPKTRDACCVTWRDGLTRLGVRVPREQSTPSRVASLTRSLPSPLPPALFTPQRSPNMVSLCILNAFDASMLMV